MTESNSKKFNLSWLGIALLVIGFAEFVFLYLINDKEALTSSIYTYYQKDYYLHLSKGELPWINFRFEYPPLAAYVLLFPAFFSGLSVLWVSILRGASTLIISILTLRFLRKCDRIPRQIQDLTGASIGLMSCIVPGFYFGLFDWTLVICNVILALLLFGVSDLNKGAKKVWPLVFGGAAIKLMPLMAAPFMIQVKELRQKSNFWLSMGITGLIHVPFLAFGFYNFKVFVAYHRMRGIDCFSTYACLLNTLERLGKVSIVRKWNYGALEVSGSLSTLFSKASLPLFAVVLIGLLIVSNRLQKEGHGAKAAFGLYLVAFLAYPAISKVSQNNYCVWTVACLVCLWLIGYNRPDFVKKTSLAIFVVLVIGFIQDRFFVDFTLPLVPWYMIVVSTVRQILTIALSIYCYREILREKPLEPHHA
ncbi:MAG: hypothetical protein WCI55_16230 [Armatimonadota bacterium]